MKTLFTTNRKIDLLTALILSIFIITFAICFTVFFKQLYYFDIDYLNITDYVSLSKETIKHNYDILIQYQSIFYKGDLLLPDFIMSETGRIHFIEVKHIFELVQYICLTTGFLSLLLCVKNIKQKEYRFLKLTSIISIGLPSIIGMLAFANFDQAFIIFHKIFFNNDYWIFDERYDPVIRILPQDFFMHCFILIIAVIILLSFICFFIYKKKQKEIIQA